MRIRQIVFAAQDLAASRRLLGELFQMADPFRDPGVAEFGIDNAVFTFGDQFIEVISPKQPDTACGRHLQRQGDSGYMLLVQTDNLARERERFTQLGVRSVWRTTLDDISAMHLHPKDVGGAIVSVDEPLPAASWRWGGPGWQVQPGARGQQRVRGITLRAADPLALAKRWAQVLARPEPQRTPQGWRVGLTGGFADFQAAPAGSVDGVAGFTLAVAEPAAVLARASTLGVKADGASLQLLGARIELEGV
jgi:Glyoxalase-like domain